MADEQARVHQEARAWVEDGRSLIVQEIQVATVTTNEGPKVHLLIRGRRNTAGRIHSTFSLILEPAAAAALRLALEGDGSWRST